MLQEELEDLMEGIKDEIDAEFMDIVLGIELLIFHRRICRWGDYQITNQCIVKLVRKFKDS